MVGSAMAFFDFQIKTKRRSAAEAILIATVGSSEKREAAISVIIMAIISAGLSLTKYGAITEMSTQPGTTSMI